MLDEKMNSKIDIKVKSHYKGATLGTFMTNIFLQNVLCLILDFTFGVWAWYFDFHKVNDI
jgi:hypothetical protein